MKPILRIRGPFSTSSRPRQAWQESRPNRKMQKIKQFQKTLRIVAALTVPYIYPVLTEPLHAQSFEWKADAGGFFDNGEYSKTDFGYSQTMYGFRFSPEVGIKYKDFSLFVGTHLLTSFGSPEYLDKAYFTGYFQYENEHHEFLFGAFPRKGLLENYTNFYIRDTFQYFRPNMTGLFYQYTGKNQFINLWMDWTGAQSATTRETFFVGLSGEQRFKWFFISLLGYYYHYSHTRPVSGDGFVHDNGQGQIGIGIDFSERAKHLHVMRLQAAFMLGYECKRDHQTPVRTPMGLVVDLHAQYWRIGTRTLYYYGQERYTAPTDVWTNTYWGNPFLKSKSYLESQWYVEFFKNDFVEAKAAFVFHLQGTRLGTQQLVQLSVNLNGSIYGKKKGKERGSRYRFNFIGADQQEKAIDSFRNKKK